MSNPEIIYTEGTVGAELHSVTHLFLSSMCRVAQEQLGRLGLEVKKEKFNLGKLICHSTSAHLITDNLTEHKDNEEEPGFANVPLS